MVTTAFSVERNWEPYHVLTPRLSQHEDRINRNQLKNKSISNEFKRGSQNVNTNLSQKETQTMDNTRNPLANEQKKESKE